jgi:hypothetical protein
MDQAMFTRLYDFTRPLDDCWEMIPQGGWSFELSPGQARLVNRSDATAEIFLRPCSLYGDRVEFTLAPGAQRAGTFVFGFLAGFEFITVELDHHSGEIRVLTHEYHKPQPRAQTSPSPSAPGEGRGEGTAGFSRLVIELQKDRLPGLPYDGCAATVFLDDKPCAVVREIDFLPESMFMFGLKGAGEITLSSVNLAGKDRPRPEYVRAGLWQVGIKSTIAAHVDSLLEGVRQAAQAGVQILATPETSLTGLRPDHPDLSDEKQIQSELLRFQRSVAQIPDAPYTVVGYPEWIDGREVEGATLDRVKVNSHRFVRPDGTLGPRMAKVHSCEPGLWHGRNYNLQRVCGVEVAVAVCHDFRYPDVWMSGVMGGARLCLHLAGSGGLGDIPSALASYRSLGASLDSFFLRVNSGGGSAIVYPASNRKHPDTILAVPRDLTSDSPSYPKYSPMGDLLAHANLRLWDAGGAYPLRALRNGSRHYQAWSLLVPQVVDV